MDHIARSMLSETLPSWNMSDSEKGLVLPVALGDAGPASRSSIPTASSRP